MAGAEQGGGSEGKLIADLSRGGGSGKRAASAMLGEKTSPTAAGR